MFDFVLTVGANAPRQPTLDLSKFSAHRPERVLRFSAGHEAGISVEAFWWESHPVHLLADRIRIDHAGFSLLAGYPLDENMKPIQTVEKFDPERAQDYDGDYFFLQVDQSGACRVIRSVVCSYPLYIAEGNGCSVLASRAMLAAVAAQGNNRPLPELGFARWICTYGGAGNTDALFEGVRNVLWNESISVRNGQIAIGEPDYGFLFDQAMQDRHARSPDKYWDEVFDYLVASMSVLGFSDIPIEFPLSGGKDSRLLLGLLFASNERGRLKRVFTNGPVVSPEVRSARMVCEALGLRHEFVDHTSVSKSQRFTMDDKILRHVHTTEGEMSPHDPTFGGRAARVIQLHGLESGLRNIAGTRELTTREKLLGWYDIHLAKGDKCQLFLPGVADHNLEDTRQFVDRALSAGMAPEQIPTLHRVLLRSGRWVSRTWRAYNDRFFAPYVFANTTLLKASFNIGALARGHEEFHFEMLRRVSPDLIEIPFAGQTWDSILLERHGLQSSVPLRWPENTPLQTTKNTHLAIYKSFETLRKFLMTHEGHVTDRLLDRDKLAEFSLEGAHPSIYLAFWNFVQVAALELVPNLESLTSGATGPEIGLPTFDF